jgi:hypothetical protein
VDLTDPTEDAGEDAAGTKERLRELIPQRRRHLRFIDDAWTNTPQRNDTPRPTLAPPSTDGEQSLDLDRLLPTLSTTARRFPGPPPSLTPDRPPEKKGAGGIAAGNHRRLLFALWSCSKGKGKKEREDSLVFYVFGRMFACLPLKRAADAETNAALHR